MLDFDYSIDYMSDHARCVMRGLHDMSVSVTADG
jgi:hypothetical protein